MEKKPFQKKYILISVLAIAVIAAVCAVVFLFTDSGKYMRAEGALASGDYDTALKLFSALEDYRDSREKVKLAENGLERKAAKKGDFITLGTYEQDGNFDNGPETLKWRVLAVEDGKMLILCRSCIEILPFHGETVPVAWEDSDIRAWLYENVYNTAFTDDEKRLILKTALTNEENDDYGTEGTGETEDYVFLLSEAEARKYCTPSTLLQVKVSMKVQADNPYANVDSGEHCPWWLRTVGGSEYHAQIVFSDATIDTFGTYASAEGIGIRPAMWIEIGE